MRPFNTLYKKVLEWSSSRYAIAWLGTISFLESFIFPYPVQDFLLASMSLNNINKAYFFAFFCTISSVIGAIVGFYIGIYALEYITPLLAKMNQLSSLQVADEWFNKYGVWIILVAGFSPVPYKIFTISAGMLSMPLLPFVLISLIARSARYFLIAFLVRKFGKQCDAWLNKYIDRLGYLLIFVVILGLWYAY
ncbi:MAG TPA: YqaA family protein [Gammaproteobacteria bacterium]|jgi:membrane protein YqaA with SNARE-associated domain|nr:YqaA family protein [Gammaproteobacteria bacterium]|tara:strand:- start:242 stop:820 length:579 start_codon:yes stop_codon:yes gene_type:complete